MIVWIKENWLTIAILVVLAAAVFAIVFSLIRNRKKRHCACGGACAYCSMCESCGKKNG